MFIIVPAIIIFLALSYLMLNDDVSLFVEVSIYIFVLSILVLTYYLYRSIKKNMKQQEINAVKLEIHELNTRLSKEQSDEQKDRIVAKIEQLQEEIKTKSNT